MDTNEDLVQRVKTYTMPPEAQQLLADNPPLFLCGITASGKNTLINKLVSKGGYELVVSHTTRQPRMNHDALELNGVDYFFVNESEVLNLVKYNKFIEVKKVHNKFYGTSIDAYKAPVSRQNNPVLDIDVQGAEEFAKAVPALRPIFLLPPNFEVWQERLNGRGKLDESELAVRYKSALMEIPRALDNTAFQLLINDDKSTSAVVIEHGDIGRSGDAIGVAHDLIANIKWQLDRHK
ncbi:MAG: hypothetical protein ABI354_00225 [Candidatus Saccharimonadales bacterium]